MADAPGLLLRITADASQLASEMSRAAQTVDSHTLKMADAANALKGAFVGMLGSLSVGAFAGLIKDTVDANASLGLLAQKTGASVEALSAMRGIAKLSGTDIAGVGDGMKLMAKNMADMADPTKSASQALAALGLEGKSVSQMGTDKAMQAIAVAMSGFGDSADKSAIAMALFGRSGAELIPFLNNLGAAGELHAKVTAEQAAQSKHLQDSLIKLSASGDAWKKELANGVIPALDDAATAVLKLANGAGGLREGVRGLSDDGSLDQWTRSAVNGLSYVLDAVAGVGVVLVQMGSGAAVAFESIVTHAKIATVALGAGFTDEGQAKIKELWDQHNAFLAAAEADAEKRLSATLPGQKLRDELAKVAEAKAVVLTAYQAVLKQFLDESAGLDAKAIAAKTDQIKAAFGLISDKSKVGNFKENDGSGAAKVDKEAEAYKRLTASIAEKTAQANAEIASAEKLTAGEKEALKLTADLEAGTIKLTKAHEADVRAKIAGQIAAEKEAEIYKRSREAVAKYAAEDIADAWKMNEEWSKKAATVQEETKKLNENTAELGLNHLELAQLKAQRDADAISTLEHQLSLQGDVDRLGDNTVALRANIDALKARAAASAANGVKQAAVDANKAAQEEWKKTSETIEKSLTDALMRGFESGKGFGQTFKETMVNLFKTMILRPIIQGVVQNGLSAVGLGGTAGASGSVTGGVQSASSLYSAGSNLYKLYNGEGPIYEAGSTAYNTIGQSTGLWDTTTYTAEMARLNAQAAAELAGTQTGYAAWAAEANAVGGPVGAGAAGTEAAGSASAGLYAVGYLAAAYMFIDWLENQGGGAKLDTTGISNNGAAGTSYATNLVSKGSLNTYGIAGVEPTNPDYTKPGSLTNLDGNSMTLASIDERAKYIDWQVNTAGNARDSEYYTKVLTPAVSGAQELVKSLGGALEGQLIAASRVTVDALGKAPDNFITGLTQVLEDGTRKVVLDSVSNGERGKTADNIVTEMSRLSLAYVQAASDIDPIFKNILSGINLATADGAKMKDALARINGAAVLINLSESLTGTNNPLAALFPKIFKEGIASVDLNALWTSAPKSIENKAAVSAAQTNLSAVEAGYKAGTQSAAELTAAQTRLTQAQNNAASENSSIAAKYPTISGAMIDYIRTLDMSKLTVEEMAKAGEQLKALDGVSDLFDKMGMGAKSLSTSFLEAIGGTVTEAMKMLPQLQTNMSAYYEGAYTAAEKLANSSKDVTRVFDGLSLSMPTSIEGFRGVVEGLDRTSESGAQTFAALMSVFPAFATLTKSIEDLGLAAGQASADFAEGQAKLRGGTNQGAVLQVAFDKAMAELNTGLRLGGYSAVNDGSVALKDTLSLTQAAFDAMLPAQQKQVLAAQSAAQALQDFSVSVSNAARDANLSLAQEALKLKGGTDAQIAQLGVDSALAKVNDWRKEQGWDAVSGDFLRNNQAVIQGMNNPNSAGFSTAYTDYANLTKDYLGTLNSLNSANQSSSTNTATETAFPTHGLQIRLLELQSVRDSIKAQEALNLRRADELQSLSAADQAIQKQIFVLEDLAAATAAATAMGDFMKGIADSIADFGKSDTQKQIDAIGKTYDDNIKKAHELATAAGHSVTVAGVTTYDATAKAQEAEIARLAQLQKQALMDALLKTSSDGVEIMGLTPLQKQLVDLGKSSTLITQSIQELGSALGWTAEQISAATTAATGYNAAQAKKLGDDFVDGLKNSLATLGMSATEKQMLDLAAAFEANKVSAAALGRGIEEATQLYTAQVAKLRHDFTAGLDESIASYGLSDYAQQVRAVEQTYQDSIATAKTLKLGQSELNKIERIRAESLQTLAQAEADAAKAARQTAESNLRSVYQGLAEGYQQTVEAAKTAESTLRSAYEARVAEITSTAEKFADFVASIREFRAALATGEQSALNPAERAAASYAAMQDAIAQARGGDAAAAGKIQGAATDYLKLAKDQSASRLDYARAVAKTQIDLQALEGSAAAQGDVSTQQLAALKLQVTGLIDLNQTEANAFESALAGYKLAQSAAWTAQGSLDQLKAQVGALIQLDDTGKTTLQQAIAEYQLAVSAEITANSALAEAKRQTDLLAAILAKPWTTTINNTTTTTGSVAVGTPPTDYKTDGVINWGYDASGRPAMFATGGTHTGGLRLVGEQGPELEVTGPSRIYSHSQTKDLFSRLQNPQSNNEALVAEIRELRALIGALIGPLTATALNTSEQARLLKRWENIGPKAARVS